MDIQIKTKFNIGDNVYSCNKHSQFYNGAYIDLYCPSSNPYKVTGINILHRADGTKVYYTCYPNKEYSEEVLFNSLEEAQQWCDDYE